MISKVYLSVILVNIVTIGLVKGYVDLPIPNEAFNQTLYEEVINAELCHEQVGQIRSNVYLNMLFADAGIRVPRGVLGGNTMDMGNYHQCIGINQQLEGSELQGKYCMIRVPSDQSYQLPDWSEAEALNFNPNLLSLDEETARSLEKFNAMKRGMLAMSGILEDNNRTLPENPLSGLTFRLAVCIPKPCTTEQAITSLLFNVTSVGFQYTDDFCRLPDDKPWVPGDMVAVVVFSIIGLLTVLSTSFDIWQTVILKNGRIIHFGNTTDVILATHYPSNYWYFIKNHPKTVSVIGRSFSVYTNGRRLMTFESSPDNLECLDGIRALAMAWVLLGHTFTSEISWVNPIEGFMWQITWQALWVTAAHFTVDTFFMLSGFLIVYTTFGKLNGTQLIKNIHLFWLNRLLRMFPLLATAVLIEATFMNRMADGPLWPSIANQVQGCRTNWWSTLLHIQNYATPLAICMSQTWYLAIDVQLHILSPIILYWVLLGKKRIAWAALLSGLVAILIASTTYNFIKEFPTTMSGEKWLEYLRDYYLNTLTRGSPFIVGMIFGYIVRTCKLEMSKITTVCFWTITFSLSTFLIYAHYPVIQPDWDNQTLDSLYNSFIRPLWGLFIGLLIYGCVYGYGGPINWFLSLKIWKIQSRLSYAMYLFHFMLMYTVNYSAVSPMHFSVGLMTFKFCSHYVYSLAVSYLMVLVIDAPFSTIFKLLLKGGPKKPHTKEIKDEPVKENDKKV